jgi:hypothetical protein
MNTLPLNQQPVTAGFRVNISRGERIGRVSSEWFSRPDDERYLSLTELHDAVRSRAERAHARTVESRSVRVEASRDDAERLSLIVPGRDEPVPRRIGHSVSCAALSARPRPTCASSPHRWPGSTCSMACCRIGPNW